MLWWTIRQTNSKDVETRKRALQIIEDSKDSEAMLKLLDHKDYRLREAAAKALGKIRNKNAVEPLMVLLTNKEKEVRCAAIKALGEIGDIKAVERLIESLQDKNADAQKAAIHALGKIGDVRAVESLGTIFEKQYWVAGSYAADALAELGETGKERLGKSLNHSDKNVRYEAAKVLDAIEWTTNNISQKVFFYHALEKQQKIVEMGVSAVDPLLVRLRDADSNERSKAAFYIGIIGDSRAVEPLIEVMLNDHAWSVIQTAAEALYLIDQSRAVDTLILLLNKTESNLYQTHIANLMVKWGDARFVKLFLELNNPWLLRWLNAVLESVLKKNRKNVEIEDLRAIAVLKDGEDDQPNFSLVRMLAQNELHRRNKEFGGN